MKWKIRYEEYSRYGESNSIIEVIEGKDELQCINAILELVRDIEEEVEGLDEFRGLMRHCDGEDKVIYVYDLTNKEFVYEDQLEV